MRIALIHNAGAGDGTFSDEELSRLFMESGHTVDRFGKRPRDVERAIGRGADVLAVAGGDGTVARAVAAAAEAALGTPLLILPVGTSNNIARSLGICRPIESIVRALAQSSAQRLDVWRIEHGGETRPFVEAAGVGFIGTMLEQAPTKGQLIARAIRDLLTSKASLDKRKARGVARLIRAEPVRRVRVIADGDDLTGDYIAVEAMNIRQIGPRVVLAPDADHGDAALDLVLITADDRERLADYVESQSESSGLPCGLTRTARSIEMAWPRHAGHVDDTPLPNRSDDGARIEIDGSVMVLGA